MATKPKGDLLFDISEREAGMLQQSIEQDSKKHGSVLICTAIN